ncbi:MAG: LysM peptidoglycan-binding domain-containing protein [Spirochaetaceae bacterium]|jgi:LysM repeat protein|nr:LysM peptidoglycan-binding domain-containing protein [Spirochaetaceae bacterium]
MKRFLSIIFITGFLGLALGASEYTVQRGDTVYSICRTYGISQMELLSMNKMSDPAKLYAGQVLQIPELGAAIPLNQLEDTMQSAGASPVYTEYRAERGDSLYGIARKADISIEELRRINGLSADYLLKVGDKIKVPGTIRGTIRTVPNTSSSGTSPQVVPGTIQQVPNIRQAPAAIPTSSSSPVPKTASTALLWPVKAKRVEYMTGKLYGVVVHSSPDERVKNLNAGTVLSAGPYRGFGKIAIIKTDDDYLYIYGGLKNLSVKMGDRLLPGAEIGELALDTETLDTMLYFMVYKNNSPIDPAKAPRA